MLWISHGSDLRFLVCHSQGISTLSIFGSSTFDNMTDRDAADTSIWSQMAGKTPKVWAHGGSRPAIQFTIMFHVQVDMGKTHVSHALTFSCSRDILISCSHVDVNVMMLCMFSFQPM